MYHSFNIEVAKLYTTDVAIFLNYLVFCTAKKLANRKNIIDGRCWVYNTLSAFCELMPYWTKRQLERVINNALNAGLIEKGNYNKSAYDRTTWYALSPKGYGYYKEINQPIYWKLLYDSISPNREMEYTSWCDSFLQSVSPIPVPFTVQDPDIYIPPISPNEPEPMTQPPSPPPSQAQGTPEGEEWGNIPVVIEKNKKQAKKESVVLTLKDLQDYNPLSIPDYMLRDFVENRKKWPLTETAWVQINKELIKFQEAGLDPIEQFSDMVTNNWRSISFNKYQEFNTKSTKKNHIHSKNWSKS